MRRSPAGSTQYPDVLQEVLLIWIPPLPLPQLATPRAPPKFPGPRTLPNREQISVWPLRENPIVAQKATN